MSDLQTLATCLSRLGPTHTSRRAVDRSQNIDRPTVFIYLFIYLILILVNRRLRFSSDADNVRLTNVCIIINETKRIIK